MLTRTLHPFFFAAFLSTQFAFGQTPPAPKYEASSPLQKELFLFGRADLSANAIVMSSPESFLLPSERLWNDKSGKYSVVARLVGFEGETQILLSRKDNNETVAVRISKLSAADLYYLANLFYRARNVAKSFEFFSVSAAQGYEKSQFGLATHYLFGHGVERDRKKAVEMLKSQSEKGSGSAVVQLSECYLNGWGVTKDQAQAVAVLTDGVDRRLPEAQCRLGDFFMNGTAVAIDYSKAVLLYGSAVEQQDPRANYRLGELYAEGLGVKKDIPKAISYFEKAFELGLTSGYDAAMYHKGLCFEKGINQEKDLEKAKEFYRKAIGGPKTKLAVAALNRLQPRKRSGGVF